MLRSDIQRVDELAPVWLPRGLSFLSGFPTPFRKRKVLVPLQAAIDDSGGKGQGPIFVLAGFVAPAEAWAAFNDRWQQCLDEYPAVRCFKMREAASLKEQFARWRAEVRDEKVRKLARIIREHVVYGVSCSVDLGSFKEFTAAMKMRRPWSEAYFWPFHLTTMNLANDLYHRGHRERFDIIFDEQVIFGPRALAWYPAAKESMEPEVRTIMPLAPMFRKDYDENGETFLPLQAADMFAWLARRIESGVPHPLVEVVRQEWKGLEHHTEHFSGEDMQRLWEQDVLRRTDRAAYERLMAEKVKTYRDAMGI